MFFLCQHRISLAGLLVNQPNNAARFVNQKSITKYNKRRWRSEKNKHDDDDGKNDVQQENEPEEINTKIKSILWASCWRNNDLMKNE